MPTFDTVTVKIANESPNVIIYDKTDPRSSWFQVCEGGDINRHDWHRIAFLEGQEPVAKAGYVVEPLNNSSSDLMAVLYHTSDKKSWFLKREPNPLIWTWRMMVFTN